MIDVFFDLKANVKDIQRLQEILLKKGYEAKMIGLNVMRTTATRRVLDLLAKDFPFMQAFSDWDD